MNKEINRIKKGKLTSDKHNISFDFGVITSLDGKFYIDLYISEDFDLNNFINDKTDKYWEKEFDINCLTEENNLLEIDRLNFRRVQPSFSKVELVCNGKMKLTKTKDTLSFDDDIPKEQDSLFYLVLEGLKMEFSDFTEKNIIRDGKIINEFNNRLRDHTRLNIKTNKSLYQFIMYPSNENDDVYLEFGNDYSNKISYSHFCEIKNNFISILSLANGADVRIRKECTGSYYSVGKIDSEIVVMYSFENIKNDRYNSYVPINNPFNRGENILNNLFMFCFEDFVLWNNKIDLNSIIYYLISSEQSKSIQEKVFIQMIAFERMTTLYAEISGVKAEISPSNEDYKPIKDELLEIIEKNKMLFGNSYNTIKSKIGNLNQIKRLSTSDKMYRILNEVNIPITNEIENLIDNCRNMTIHKGEIGEGDELFVNFLLIDELIREIILRLIKYRGPRDSRILLKK